MIGQEDVKQKARIAIGAAMQRREPLPHVLQTSSGGGLGKTCFARILANEMFSPLVETSGPCVASVADLRRVLVQLEPGSLLHIDEAHVIGRPAAEELLLVLEERVLNLKLDGTALRLPSSTVTDVLEPPLVRLGLMMVTPGGRLITDPGRRHLQQAMSEHSASISSALGVLSGSIEDETQP